MTLVDADARSDQIDAATLAVLAHGLLNSLTSVIGAVDTLRATPSDETTTSRLLSLASNRSREVADVLRGLALGLPADAFAYLQAAGR